MRNNDSICYVKLFIVFIFLPVLSSVADGTTAETEAHLWEGISEGRYYVAMRHALAPGFGDPEGFALHQCETQRNLSEVGVQQANRIGDRFRENGITSALVYTSQWCRCQDTARHLGLGDVRDLAALNSFFRDFELRDSRTNEILEWLQNHVQTTANSGPESKPLVLVTHQVNISALLGVGATSGEMVVFGINNEGDPEVKGSIVTP